MTHTGLPHLVCLAWIFFAIGAGRAGVVIRIDDGLAAVTTPAAPSNLVVTVTSPTTVGLSWSDHSTNETRFDVYIMVGSSADWQYLGSLSADGTSAPVQGLISGGAYSFAVVAANAAGTSSPAVAGVTLPGITSRAYHPATVGQPFVYTLTASTSAGSPESFSVTGSMPPGLTHDPGSAQITGSPIQAGIFNLTLTAHYTTWGPVSRAFTLRVVHPPGPPVARTPAPALSLAANGPPQTIPLGNWFSDPDAEAAVRVTTGLGSFDVALYASACPQTVTNFLNYVDRGDYAASIVHRSIPGFIVQGGGFKTAPPGFTRIPTDPSPTNEPGISNLRGTIAMAKIGGDPNSATAQWFINLGNNSGNLDNQNGGFTAFGRVCGAGMTVVDAIAALPRGTYTVTVDGQNATFADWPLDTAPPAPAAMDTSKLVQVQAAARIDPLTYAVASLTATGLVEAVITGSDLVLTPLSSFGGCATLNLTVTDRDGNDISAALPVTVNSPYTAWLEQFELADESALPEADAEDDRVPNATEFVLMGSPLLADPAASKPAGSLRTVENAAYAVLTFNLRKERAGAEVVISASANPAGAAWSPVWTSAAIDSPLILTRRDGGDHWQMTVRDTLPLPANTGRFLRVQVVLP